MSADEGAGDTAGRRGSTFHKAVCNQLENHWSSREAPQCRGLTKEVVPSETPSPSAWPVANNGAMNSCITKR